MKFQNTLIAIPILLFCLLNSGFAQPLGWPPGNHDTKLLNAVPDSVLFLNTWSESAEVDAKGNLTEQWYAQEEIQTAFKKFKTALIGLAENDPNTTPLQQKFLSEGVWRLLKTSGVGFLESYDTKKNLAVGAIVINAKDSKEYFSELISESVESFGDEENASVRQILGEDVHRLVIDNVAVEVGFSGPYLVLAFGGDNWEAVAERMNTQSAAPEWLTKKMEQSKVERLISFSYVGVAELMGFVSEMDEKSRQSFDQVNDVLKLEEMKSVTICSGMDSISSITRINVETGHGGIMSAFDVDPISKSDFAELPSEAFGMFVFKVSAENIMQLIQDVPGLEDGADPDFLLGLASGFLGIEVEDDLIAQLEGTVRAYSSGSILTSRTVCAVKVKDAAAFRETLETVNERIRVLVEARGGTFTTKKSRSGVTSYGVRDAETGSVYWALDGDDLYFSNNSRAITSHIRKAKDPEGKVIGELFTKQILSDQAGKGDLIGLQRIDLAPLFETVLPLLATFLGDQKIDGFDFSFADVPDVGVITKGFRPNTTIYFKTTDGFESHSRHDAPISIEATTGIMIGMLLPAVQQVRAAARRTTSMNNLRQLQLALLNYESANQSFPAAYSTDDDGSPLLSWRVHVLPYMGYSDLYDEFHLDEPWNSEHNIKLVEKMPAEFSSPQLVLETGETVYVAPVGEDTVIRQHPHADGGIKGNTFGDLEDGASATVLVCEIGAAKSVIWTAPEDLNLDDLDMEFDRVVDSGHVGTFLVGASDGSVHATEKSVLTAEYLRGICNMSDGKLYDPLAEGN